MVQCNVESYMWTYNEVELLLNMTLEYNILYINKNGLLHSSSEAFHP